MRDVNYGWLIRYIHMNGASMFFVVVYMHVFRGLYYGSYRAPRELLWMIGVVILLLMMATAFMGYVLPWGQMSYWGATVRSEEHTSELQSLMRISYAVFCLKKNKININNISTISKHLTLYYLV